MGRFNNPTSNIRPKQIVQHCCCFTLFSIFFCTLIVLLATLDKHCFDSTAKGCNWHCLEEEGTCSWCSDGWLVPQCIDPQKQQQKNSVQKSSLNCGSMSSCQSCLATQTECGAPSGFSYVGTLVLLVVALVLTIGLFVGGNMLIMQFAEIAEANGDNNRRADKMFEQVPDDLNYSTYPRCAEVSEPLLSRSRGSNRNAFENGELLQVDEDYPQTFEQPSHDAAEWDNLRNVHKTVGGLTPKELAERQMRQWGYR